MAKGACCPACGELKFHKKDAVSTCTACGATGWRDQPGKPGGGKGAACNLCGEQKLRKIGAVKGVGLYHCYGCKVSYLL